VLKSSYFDNSQLITNKSIEEIEEMSSEYKTELSKKRFDKLTNRDNERFISCSDDFKIILWNLDAHNIRIGAYPKLMICKMHGHQQAINMAKFSPNGSYIASGSFDKSLRV